MLSKTEIIHFQSSYHIIVNTQRYIISDMSLILFFIRFPTLVINILIILMLNKTWDSFPIFFINLCN